MLYRITGVFFIFVTVSSLFLAHFRDGKKLNSVQSGHERVGWLFQRCSYGFLEGLNLASVGWDVDWA